MTTASRPTRRVRRPEPRPLETEIGHGDVDALTAHVTPPGRLSGRRHRGRRQRERTPGRRSSASCAATADPTDGRPWDDTPLIPLLVPTSPRIAPIEQNDMTVDDRTRLNLHRKLEAVLGTEEADT